MLQDNKRSLKIFLVDDDAEDREFFAEIIFELNPRISLETFENGLEFIKALDATNLPDLVFLDLNMPMMNGIQSLKEVRSMEEFKKIPVIAIYSTSTSEMDHHETFRLGADAYLSKPNDFSDLKVLLSKILDINWKERVTDRKNFVITPL